ncbi:MAG: riboflavin synthase [Gammaproteobacteria bacterium]|nr:riboflavin synthase [Gammaproteobacteria bacterium]
MFTGIIEAVGSITTVTATGPDLRLTIEAGELDLDDVRLGDSIAVNGVCLTVTHLTTSAFSCDVSRESLLHTTHRHLKAGARVNLEKALTLQSRLGGHLVSGHVDGIGEVISSQQSGFSLQLKIAAPPELSRYIAAKGSITIDGVSLTVTDIEGSNFQLNIIPHTLAGTTLEQIQPGREVNLEVDLLARYVERLLTGSKTPPSHHAKITPSLLAENGYL